MVTPTRRGGGNHYSSNGTKKTSRRRGRSYIENLVAPQNTTTTITGTTTGTTRSSHTITTRGHTNKAKNSKRQRRCSFRIDDDDSVSSTTTNNSTGDTSTLVNHKKDDEENGRVGGKSQSLLLFGRLPTPMELSEELCKVVDTVHYSDQEALDSLDQLFEWAYTGNTTFLITFYQYAGVIRLIDFLTKALQRVDVVATTITSKEDKEQDNNIVTGRRGGEGNYSRRKGAVTNSHSHRIRCNSNRTLSRNPMRTTMRCINKVARLIGEVTYAGENNKEIATKNAIAVVDCEGIQTLLLAAQTCTSTDNNNGDNTGDNIRNTDSTSSSNNDDDDDDDDDTLRLETIREIRSTFNNVTHHTGELMGKEKALSILDSLIHNITEMNERVNTIITANNTDTIDMDHNNGVHDNGSSPSSSSSSSSSSVALDTIRAIFDTLSNIVINDYVTKEYFQQNQILFKFLTVVENININNNKKNDHNGETSSTEEEEKIIKSATRLFALCHKKQLLVDNDNDSTKNSNNSSNSSSKCCYASLLPICVVGLQRYPTNHQIRKSILKLLTGACLHIPTTNNETRIMEKSGVMEVLSSLLTLKDTTTITSTGGVRVEVTVDVIDDTEKTKIRTIIGKIIATP